MSLLTETMPEPFTENKENKQMKKTVMALSVGIAITSFSVTAAELQQWNHLSIESGSYFSFGGGAYGTVPILGEDGLLVGPAQGDTGSGSHGGKPVAGDVGAVTQPWDFFYSTGYDYLSPDNGSGSFGGDTTNGVDMTAWTVTWNTLANIPMGGCSLGDIANNAGFSTCDQDRDGNDDFVDSGTGTFEWSGVYGDSYTITYTAHVPAGDPSLFGSIPYDLVLVGKVTTGGPPGPTSKVSIKLPDGDEYECVAGGANVTANAVITTTDVNDIASIEWTLDGNPAGSGDSFSGFIALGEQTLKVLVNTVESDAVIDSITLDVSDTLAPEINAAFVSTQTGEEVAALSDLVKSAHHFSKIAVSIDVNDACDNNPIVDATLGIDVASEDKFRLNRGKNKLQLQGDMLPESLTLSIGATDATGNTTAVNKTLSR